MEYRDYYKTLGVERNADEKAIRKAYRDLARKFHPDVNPNNKDAEAKFKEINEAYDTLKDPQKRAAYDRYGKAAFQGGGGGQVLFSIVITGALVSIIPVIVVFLLLQRFWQGGLTAGAIK